MSRVTRLAALSCAVFALCLTRAGAQAPLVLAPGYGTTVFYDDPLTPAAVGLTEDDAGRIYLAYRSGEIRVLQDADADLQAETSHVYWGGAGVTSATGILWHAGRVYVSHFGKVSVIDDLDGDLQGDVITDLVTSLPAGLFLNHQNNALFTDGSWIYFGMGSASDHGVDAHPYSGTVLRMSFDGTQISVFATGLRNVFDGAVHPVTGAIIVGDNAPNQLPAQVPVPDELNRLVQGGHYGHPFEWGTPAPGSPYVPPLCELTAHSAPTGIAFNTNTAISGYRNDLLLAAFGGGISGGLVRVTALYGPVTAALGVVWEPLILGLQNPVDCHVTQRGHLLIVEYTSGRVLAFHQLSEGVITIESASCIGTTCQVTFESAQHAGDYVFAAAAHGLGAPVALGGNIVLHLDLQSALLAYSVTPGNATFSFPFPGVLDAQGRYTGAVNVPNAPSLIGLEVYLQFVVVSATNGSFRASSPPQKLVVLPLF